MHGEGKHWGRGAVSPYAPRFSANAKEEDCRGKPPILLTFTSLFGERVSSTPPSPPLPLFEEVHIPAEWHFCRIHTGQVGDEDMSPGLCPRCFFFLPGCRIRALIDQDCAPQLRLGFPFSQFYGRRTVVSNASPGICSR